MQYVRPKPVFKLSKQERADLLKCYYEFCAQQAGVDVSTLNIKVPRAAFSDLHNRVGEFLLEASKRLAVQPGPLRDFLGAHPLPECMKPYLSDEYRAFCLALNSLKQWSVMELNATDRYLLGSRARAECREMATNCLLSGERLEHQHTELHHPARDGRPPIPITKAAHAKLEGQSEASDVLDDPVGTKLKTARLKLNRSWVFIELGCRALRGEVVDDTRRAPAAKSIVRRIIKETGLTLEQISEWMARHP